MTNFNNCFFSALILLLLTTIQNISASPLWQSNNVYLLHGTGFEVDSNEQTTLTLEHTSKWSIGDLFFFTDLTKYRGSEQGDGVYAEFSPRISIGKLSSTHFDFGPVKDLLITSTVEFGKGDIETFLIGPAFDLNLSGFDYFSLNIYRRFTKNDRDGETIQITPVWGMSHNLGGANLIFEGFIDWNVNSDGNYHSNLHFNPRLKYDLHKLLNVKSGSAMFGIEYSYWKNKYGIKSSSQFDTNQSAISLLLNYKF
ncbi:MAG: DUF5020 family protein [Pseudomonadota bacterium]